MSLTLANPASETLEATMPVMATQTVTTAPTGASAPVAGDNNNNNLPASGTVLIVVGVVLGIIGVASVIVLIWWMRRRAMARYRMQQLPMSNGRSGLPPAPPPKSSSSKALPQLNVNSANAYRPGAAHPKVARTATNDSMNTDKALPGKPIESVWNSPTERHNKSPALTSVNELKNSPKLRSDEEMAMQRMRSESIGSYEHPTQPINYI